MSGFGFFNKHRTWEDWFGMALGILIGLSPWVVERSEGELPMLNAVSTAPLPRDLQGCGQQLLTMLSPGLAEQRA